MKWSIIDAKPTEDFKLVFTFEGEKKRIFDFKSLFNDKINELLRNIDFFMKAKVHHHTVMWNKNLAVCLEYLYEKSVKIK